MKNLDFIKTSEDIINLSENSTEESIELSSLCETIKIKVINLTPSWKINIPVRFCENYFDFQKMEEKLQKKVSLDTLEKIEELFLLLNS